MRDIYIVSDVHGKYANLQDALEMAGLLINKPGRGLVKKRDAFVVQIGDLANCVRESVDDDFKCLSVVGSWIDLMLVGNHEIPYFHPENTFAGFYYDRKIYDRLWELNDAGFIWPAYEHGLTLITHAGITLSQLSRGTGATAWEVASKLAREWSAKNFSHYLFRDCGRARYGRAEHGGVLWCDFDKEFGPTKFPQIVGHTPGVLRSKGNALCIDTQLSTGLPTVLKVG